MDDLLRLQYPKPGRKLDPDALPFEARLDGTYKILP